jgi:hypothetical protein
MKGVKCVSEVCSTDVVLKYPINPRILEVWLAVNMNMEPDRVLCYDVKEPRRVEADIAAERVSADKDRDADMDDAALMDEDMAHYEAQNEDADDALFGEEYNQKFLAELEKIKAEKGADYFRNYPTKDEIMGDDLRAMWDDLHHGTNMGRGQEKTKEVDIISQGLGH